ncbi:MAG: nitrile hydratase accessory protein [Paracoccaceae bacterium]|nr:nitrile hydratase accessory protein [Paracoccaceae bacterium]
MTQTDIVFHKPWHAHVSAIVHALQEAGAFSAAQWSQTLGAERARQQVIGQADAPDSYFIAVLDSLLRLLGSHDPALATELRETTEAWRTAYLTTPHGAPVELKAAR